MNTDKPDQQSEIFSLAFDPSHRKGWDRLPKFEKETRDIYRRNFEQFLPPAPIASRTDRWLIPVGRGIKR